MDAELVVNANAPDAKHIGTHLCERDGETYDMYFSAELKRGWAVKRAEACGEC